MRAQTRQTAARTVLVLLFGVTPCFAGATQELEQSARYHEACSHHYSQLEHDAQEVARDFCSNRGGIRSVAPFEHDEELIRINEFSKAYRCTVKSRVECYAE